MEIIQKILWIYSKLRIFEEGEYDVVFESI